jgi:hypothetical protein
MVTNQHSFSTLVLGLLLAVTLPEGVVVTLNPKELPPLQ